MPSQDITPPKATAEKNVTPAAPKPKAAAAPVSDAVKMQRTKAMLLVFSGSMYVLYLLTCGFFLSVLPSIDPQVASLASIATGFSVLGGFVFLLLGFFLFSRIVKADVSVRVRQMSLLKIIAAMIPGLAISVATPLMVMREPTLPIDIVDPVNAEDFVAPLAVTFSAQRATEILQSINLKPIQYQWDTDGDGTVNDTTVLPVTTAIFDRQGVYVVTLSVQLEGNQRRKLTRRITIPRAVFSVTPSKPVVERPVRFSVAHLLSDPKLLKEVQWDFSPEEGDEEKTAGPEAVHTYYAKGRIAVGALVLLTNNTQLAYSRTITVDDPPPLPFAVTLESDPKQLVGPAPFGAVFRIVTQEPLKEVAWSFSEDDKEERGADLRRMARSFDQPGVYPVTVKVRSMSGQLAELTTIVRVTEKLQLSDLKFEGEPTVRQNFTVKGEAPLRLSLTPKTSAPLIDFSWEDPQGEAVINGTTISRVFRIPGSYILTLIGQNPEKKTLRQNITVQVDSAAPQPVITMKPEGGIAPLTVVFDAADSFIPPGFQVAGFEWLFGDEGSQDNPVLGAARIEHTYRTGGEFTVTLRIVMNDGKDYKTQKTLIVRRPSLSACIQESRTTVQAGKGVVFDSSCSIGMPSRVLWDVRNDISPLMSVAQSPEAQYVHVFEQAGTYTVTLTIFDQFGNSNKKTTSILVTP